MVTTPRDYDGREPRTKNAGGTRGFRRAPEKLAEPVKSPEDFRDVLTAYRHQQGLSQLDVDHLAGLQDGYTGKIEIGTRHCVHASLWWILGALGLTIRIEPAE